MRNEHYLHLIHLTNAVLYYNECCSLADAMWQNICHTNAIPLSVCFSHAAAVTK